MSPARKLGLGQRRVDVPDRTTGPTVVEEILHNPKYSNSSEFQVFGNLSWCRIFSKNSIPMAES